MFSENLMTEKPENTLFVKQGSPNIIREGGRTVGSGRVASIIE
jgi:translation elongation factor EF-Tu-like GTPase